MTAKPSAKKQQLDKAIQPHCLCIVGSGYIDIIVHRKKIKAFIEELNKIEIFIDAATWWCLVSEEKNSGCPHGLGGPMFNDSYLSEITHEYDNFLRLDSNVTVHNNNVLKEIMNKKITDQLTYSGASCLHVGLWLDVPDSWESTFS